MENESSDTNNEASRNTKNRVALTAHVLIALEETAEVIQVNFNTIFLQLMIPYSYNRYPP